MLQMLQEMTIECRGVDPTQKDPQSRLDRAAIMVPSDRDRGVLPHIAYAVGLESDAPDSREEREKTGVHRSRRMKIRSRSTRCSHRARSHPSNEDPPIMMAPCASKRS